MIEKDKLKEYARKLMFDMEESEYDTLQEEFSIILKQMELIEKIENISLVEPMSYPFMLDDVVLRDDTVNNELSTHDLLLNADEVENNQIVVPKVVE